MRITLPIIFIISSTFLLFGCGEESNINNIIFVDRGEENSTEFLLKKGQHLYDRKNFDAAVTYANKILSRERRNSDAAVLAGYASLAKAGVDVFKIISNLSDLSGLKSTSTTLAATGADSANNVLDKLNSALFNDSNEDLAQLVNADGIPLSGTAARNQSNVIKQINVALIGICPFVDNTAKQQNPTRYGDCPQYENLTIKNHTKIHFLWALVHLSEATAFFSAVNKTILEQQENLQTPVSDITAQNAGDYINKISKAADTINALIPTNSGDTLVNEILNNLKTTNLALGQIEGMPDEVTKAIDAAINTITNPAEKATTTPSSSPDIAQLKEQLTSKMGDDLGKKIDDLQSKNKITTEQVSTACEALKKISTTNLPPQCE